eukprot:6196606-Pleurochrysis_carterae.AAC.5
MRLLECMHNCVGAIFERRAYGILGRSRCCTFNTRSVPAEIVGGSAFEIEVFRTIKSFDRTDLTAVTGSSGGSGLVSSDTLFSAVPFGNDGDVGDAPGAGTAICRIS